MKSDSHITSYKQELKVVAVVVLFILVMEVIARWIAPHLDYDRMHISKFDEIVAEMPAKEIRSDGHLAILGNSLLMHGFDASLFKIQLPDVQLTKLTPVGTAIHDWDMIFKRYLENEASMPKHLLIGFVAHHIDDSEPVKLRRMARHFAGLGDLPYLWQHENFDFHLKTQSVLSRYSSMLGDQPEHRLRSLEYLIPEYRSGLNANKDFVSHSGRQDSIKTEIKEKTKPGFKRITRFLENCKKNGIQVYLVPMPQPKVWDLDPQVVHLAKRFGAKVLDARAIEGMGEEDFSDGYHLGETGNVKFTKWLANVFNQLGVYRDE